MRVWGSISAVSCAGGIGGWQEDGLLIWALRRHWVVGPVDTPLSGKENKTVNMGV